MDNADADLSVTGSLPMSTSVSSYLGANYQVHAANGVPPTTIAAGTGATYTVATAQGSTPVTVNQQAKGGAWHLLGTFALDPGTTGAVTLTGQAGYVVADALGSSRMTDAGINPGPRSLTG